MKEAAQVAYKETDMSAVYHYYCFHDCLVSADFGALQCADVCADPGDESEFGPFAHLVAHRNAHKPELSFIICVSNVLLFIFPTFLLLKYREKLAKTLLCYVKLIKQCAFVAS